MGLSLDRLLDVDAMLWSLMYEVGELGLTTLWDKLSEVDDVLGELIGEAE